MKSFLSLSVVFLVLVSGSVSSAEETKVKFAIGEWPPYTGLKIDKSGMAVEIVTAACNAVGLKAEYEFFPWKRAENNVLNGQHLGTFPYKELKERVDIYLFSDTLFNSSFGILVNKRNKRTANFNYTKPDDFKGYSVGIVSGTDAVRIPLEAVGVNVEDAQTPERNLLKFKNNRIDFYIDDKAVIVQVLKQSQAANNFKLLETNFGEKNEFKIMVSKKYPNSQELLKKVNEGLKKIKETGKYNEILNAYGL